MLRKKGTARSGLGSYSGHAKLAADGVRRLNGMPDVAIYQSKRFIDADALAVDGAWIPVKLDLDMCGEVAVHSHNRKPPVDKGRNEAWLDDNGRWITD